MKIKGRHGTYPVDPGNLPLRATVILDPPLATTGQCLELTWAEESPRSPSCASAAGGGTVKCR